MTAFVLIPGAGGAGWYWSRTVPLLQAAGHEAIAVDLPGDDETAGIHEYADIVVAAVVAAAADPDDVVLVAQSMGGFTAPLVCERIAVRELVFVNAMIPVPGETAGDWGGNVGSSEARQDAAECGGYDPEFDESTYFLHDVPAEVAAEGEPHQRSETGTAFGQSCDFDGWPDISTRVLAGADDRLFPAGFQRRVAWERLRVEADVIAGGHLVALANPAGLADYLLRH